LYYFSMKSDLLTLRVRSYCKLSEKQNKMTKFSFLLSDTARYLSHGYARNNATIPGLLPWQGIQLLIAWLREKARDSVLLP
jgi:hypothetical protein